MRHGVVVKLQISGNGSRSKSRAILVPKNIYFVYRAIVTRN